MENNLTKDISIISVIMILINICGIIYQIITKANLFPIIMKIVYISLFTIILFFIYKKSKYTSYICFLTSIVICVYSGMNFDFLSVVIAIVLFIYAYKYLYIKKNINKNYPFNG